MQIKALMHDKNKYQNHILETEEELIAQSSFAFFISRIWFMNKLQLKIHRENMYPIALAKNCDPTPYCIHSCDFAYHIY